MGRKVHPMGFRLGIIRDWQSRWYAEKHYHEFLAEDLKVRRAIRKHYNEAGISLVEIERQANKVLATIHTARPGVVIGRGGQRVDEMRQLLESLIDKKIQLNIVEIHQPELDAYLVARALAEQIGRRIAYRRAMKQAMFRTLQAGAKGIRINCAGRLGGAEIARRQMMHQGQVPLHTLRADVDYGFTEAHTVMGRIGIKVWIYKGDILPEAAIMDTEVAPVEPVAAETVAPVETEPNEAAAEVKDTEATPVEPVAEETAAPVESKTDEAAAEVKDTEATPVEPVAEETAAPIKSKTDEAAAEVKDTEAAPVEAIPVETAAPVESETDEATAEVKDTEATPVEPETIEPEAAVKDTEVTEPVENKEAIDTNSHVDEKEGSDNASTQPG